MNNKLKSKIKEIVTNIDNSLFLIDTTEDKIKAFEDICKPYLIQDIINELNDDHNPLWYPMFLNHIDLFNHYSKYINKTIQNCAKALTIPHSLEHIQDWFNPLKIDEALKLNAFLIEHTNLEYAIENNLIHNYQQVVTDITNSIPQLNNATESKEFEIDYDTINILFNHYYDLTNDIELIKKAAQELNNSDLFEHDNFYGLHKISGIFRTEFLDIFLQDSLLNKTITGVDIFIKNIMDKKEFPQHKSKIFERIFNSELLFYGIVIDYFTKDDFFNFVTKPHLKDDMQHYLLENSIGSTKQKRKIKV